MEGNEIFWFICRLQSVGLLLKGSGQLKIRLHCLHFAKLWEISKQVVGGFSGNEAPTVQFHYPI